MKSEGFSRTDYAVIAVLWGLDFFDPWTQAWGDLTIKHIFGETVKSTSYEIGFYVLLFAKCAAALAGAFIVDLKNSKFLTYFILLIVHSLTSLWAIVAIISEYAPLAFIVPWFMAISFVTTPLRFCCIFNQKPNATPDETRLVVALFEFLIGISSYLLTTSQEDLDSFPVLFLIVIWTIKIPVNVLIITLTDSVKKYVRKDVVTERTVQALVGGIQEDLRSALRKKWIGQFALFAILLQPILIITFIDGVLTSVDHDSNKHIARNTLFKKYEFLAQLVGLPLICVFLSMGRGIIGRFGDLLVIGLAHAFNTLICILLYLYLRDKAAADELARDMQRGSPTGQAALIIINGTGDQYYVRTPFFESPNPIGVLNLDVVLTKGASTFTLEIQQPEYPPLTQTVSIGLNERYRFLIIGTEKKITKLIWVSSEDDSKVRETETVLVIMNGIVGETVNGIDVPVGSKDHVIEIEQSGQVLYRARLPPSRNMLRTTLPTGDTKFSYYCQNSNLTGVFQPAKVRVLMEPYTEVTLVISNDGRTHMRIYNTLFVPSDLKLSADRVFSSTYSLAGLAQSATGLGYTQFFWTESPVRLRSTIYAFFIVSNELIKYLTKLLGSISPSAALWCILLSSLGFVVHVGFGIWYDLRFRRETWL